MAATSATVSTAAGVDEQAADRPGQQPIASTSGGTRKSTDTLSNSRHAASTTKSVTAGGSNSKTEPEFDDVFSDASFLSFEDWKRQILEKDKGAADAMKDERRRRAQKENQEILDSLGDDHEIDIDFGALFGDKKANKSQLTKDEGQSGSRQTKKQGKTTEISKAEPARYRSKDAGKTCKERTNFASFDSGAQVMKANPEAQSASQILSENKDRYMLNVCSAKNKFLIVELSDSILVDTVALANFEFFSSTFRQFRLSVSDQYPVKLDKWVGLGVFEAKNSREIQAFLVKDPRIWARYLRIEFLSHYGGEFYCPISLLRVHGRTMIQDILNQDQQAEDEAPQAEETLKEAEGEMLVPEAVADIVEEEEKVAQGVKEAKEALVDLLTTADSITTEQRHISNEADRVTALKALFEDAPEKLHTSPWSPTKSLENLMIEQERLNACYAWEKELDDLTSKSLSETTDPPENRTADPITSTDNVELPDATLNPTPTRDASQPTIGHNVTQPAPPTMTSSPVIESKPSSFTSIAEQMPSSPVSHSVSSSSASTSTPSVASSSSQSSNVAPSQNRTSVTSSSQQAQPTTQESFFKNVSKRLQNLEQDSTLSLKYIEEQSRSLREAFNRAEKRQLDKVAAFLENLNSTVIPQLKNYQDQYDQIWQSTVFELEGQKDLLQRETVAMSSRLKLLADELVFQKRMAIAQSILLLLCLGLVLFGRYLPGGIEIWRYHIAGMRDGNEAYDSNLSSPQQNRSPATSPGPRRAWNLSASGPVTRRNNSNLSQRSGPSFEGPPTPLSDFSEMEASPPPQHTKENQFPFQGADVVDGIGRRLTGGTLPTRRVLEQSQGVLTPEDSDISHVKKQMEDAIQKELLPAFSGTPHAGQPSRLTNGASNNINNERSWIESPGHSPQSSFSQSQRQGQGHTHTLSDIARNGNPSARRAVSAGPQIRVTPQTPSEPGSPRSPQAETPRRFSIARKPLPALPTEGNGN